MVSKGIVKAQQAQYIHVQPNDVLGWGIFKQPDSFRRPFCSPKQWILMILTCFFGNSLE